jgi:aryl-alcohol dehydrogenase-like predicted oxidoreductase
VVHIGGFDVARVRHAINAALRGGLRHFDVAHRYTQRKRAA